MGSAHSSHSSVSTAADMDEDDDDEPSAASAAAPAPPAPAPAPPASASKVLEQEPEELPCRAADSPLSPQPSAAGTPRLLAAGPTIKVWDPCHVLLPPPSPHQSQSARAGAGAEAAAALEVVVVSHGECAAAMRPDLVGGRWPAAALTARGERQARALAVFLRSRGARLAAAYASPLDRARATAALVCRELDFPEEQIQVSDALTEMSQGQWEGCPKSEVYTPEMVNLMDSTQPDFSAPAGESLRQVQFRMMEFLNQTVVRLPEKVAMGDSLSQQNEAKGLSRQSSTNSVQDGPPWDLLYRLNRHSLQRKKSGKSRLQFVTSGDNETEDDFSPKEINQRHILHEANLAPSVTSIAIFSHATPIRCLVAGVLDCNPMISQRICIEDSSITVLEHSLKTGWQIKRLNDTAHLRLL
ncbi:uncharacterized protein [Oryza sativa Japonica Group]|uniref:Fructose-2,6-bisphosphatase, putative n=3 Tax=Oryza TaxID=4527 RepID=Q2R3H9_ORYSJ|nr:uncharacterized protein LOC4350607 [Oryza sativa Japonica Group]ABA93956.1 Fructose-2,6-bisphosphatase, putative [Oryza sativa Japonica Group]KAF2911040.1 hypothetical protein DAI22_11g147700 [Oryza sativa Japonica Group]BAH01488.1 unnamed protein product [Oryza sativa Japonica Group]BAT14210.1 Os11g0522000 [Oryza sativa Japonica Group]